jgi:hypothetical protein
MATWTTSIPSTTHDLLAAIWCLVQDGRSIVDDVSGQPIKGIEHYADLLDLDNPLPLSTLDRNAIPQPPLGRADLEAETREFVAAVRSEVDGTGAARTHERRIKATALIAQHVHDIHGSAPATVPGANRGGARGNRDARPSRQRGGSGSRQPRRPASASASSGPHEPRG